MGDQELLERFYSDVLWELGEHARRKGSTAIGAAAVLKRVGQAHGLVIADRLPVPRLSRAEREDQTAYRDGWDS